ncbi:hypothetical protein [Sinimarinibacterium thermocellulolyticum]|uniref:Peptidase S8/S53 domain-containing protein n=1 Tax=Sinimarinibacterium thermocellulolyticum TaxID=3170016 RepID=A0ABV2ADV4_9GAMM
MSLMFLPRLALTLAAGLVVAACGDSTPAGAPVPPPVGGGAGGCPPAGESIVVAELAGTTPVAAEGVALGGDQPEHTIRVPSGCDIAQLVVRLRWDLAAEDLDLEVYFPDGSLASTSADFNLLEGAAEEIATVGNPPPGDYRVRVIGYVSTGTAYDLLASAEGGDTVLPPADLGGLAAGPAPRVVVAVIDSGINPYHAYFHAGSPIYPQGAPPSAVTRDVLAEFGIPAQCVIELTRTGDFAADFAADVASGQWRKADFCELVWFKGTNVLAKSFAAGTTVILPDDEGDTHGVGTAAAVLGANPEAIVLFLEGIGDAAETYAFTHPAVDLVSTSYGAPGSLPLPGHINMSFTGTYANGKLHFGACDNSPSSCVQDGTGGPWWSIGIAGFEETADNEPAGSSGGRQSLSGNLVDFIADFTQTLPYCMACEDGYDDFVGGTSFATPRSAGTASKILLAARRTVGHVRGIRPGTLPQMPPAMVAGAGLNISNWQLRRALEQAAWIPEFGDYDPLAGVQEFGPGYPIPPAAAASVIGWGVLTPAPEAGVVERALGALGLRAAPPAKDPSYCRFQTALIQARKLYWDYGNVDSETYLDPPSPDPFVYCD